MVVEESYVGRENELGKDGSKGIDINSQEMFPSLGTCGEAFTLVRPTWGSGQRSSDAVVKKTGITQVFQMPADQQRQRRDGPEKNSLAEICGAVGKDTNTLIDASRSGLSGALTFVIRGEEDNIMVARRRLWSRLAETITMELEIPENCLRLIIGPGGKTINSLMAQTSTRINIPKKYNGHIMVTGDFEGITLAKDRIMRLIENKINRSTSNLIFEKHLLPFLVGTSSRTKTSEIFTAMAEEKGVKIVISLNKDDSNRINILITGDRIKVNAIEEGLLKQLEEARQIIKSVETKVPRALHRLIVGPKGETLTAMEDASGCLIHVPPPSSDPNDEKIIIYGVEGNLLKGLQAVLDKTASLDSQTVKCEGLVKELIQHVRKKELRGLENKYGVHFHPGSDGIRVDGKRAEVAMTLMELKKMIEELSTLQVDKIMVRSDLVKHIVGKKGHTLESIQSQFDVTLLIPDATEGQETTITIAGKNKNAINKAKENLKHRIDEYTNFITRELKVDKKFHGLLIGPKGANTKIYREKYPEATIDFTGDHISIRGPSDQVNALSTEIETIAQTLKHEAILKSYTNQLSLTEEQSKMITDKNGMVLKSLSHMARDKDVKLTFKTGVLTFQGLKNNADIVKALLEQHLKELANRGTEMVHIPHEYHSILIGKGGKNIKHLAQKYSVKLTIPDAQDLSNDTITITGPKNNLDTAKAEITEFIEYEKSHNCHETFQVPKSSLYLIKGKSGLTIAAISSDTDTRIDISKAGVDMTSENALVDVIITGSREGIIEAKRRMMELVKKSMETSTKIIPVDAKSFELLNGIAAFALRSYCKKWENSGLTVIPSVNKSQLLLRGKNEIIEVAEANFKDLLESIAHFAKETIKIPAIFHREIIGNKGANITRIRNTFNVNIIIPRESNNDNIIVSGHEDNVQKVKLELLRYLKSSQLVPMKAAYRADIAKMLSNELSVLGITVQDHKDGLLMTGSDDNLQDASTKLSTLVEKFKQEKAVEELEVPRKFHGALIGKNGLHLAEIRQETGCNVVVPKPSENSDMIQLCGSPESLAKAREAINQFVSRLK